MTGTVENPVRVVVVIPVYNHADTLRGVVKKTMAVHSPIIVVDDGCTDGGPDTLEGLDIILIRHGKNRGKGAAILTASKKARQMRMSHMITLDADGQHNPGDIHRLLSVISRHRDAIVVGIRDFEASVVPGSSRFGRKFSNFWFRLQTGQTIGDTQSGFRAYPVNLLNHLDFTELGFAFEVEALVRAAWAGVLIRGVGIPVFYPPKRARISHFHRFWDNFALTRLNTRLTLRSFLPIPHRQLASSGEATEKISIRHPLRSLRRLLKETGSTPLSLGLSSALGIFIGAMPLIGLHTVMILFVAKYLRLSPVTAVAASQLCMPPIVPAICIEAGHVIRYGKLFTDISIETLGYQGLERLREWGVGSLFVGPLLGMAVGGIVFGLAFMIQKKAVKPQIHDVRANEHQEEHPNEQPDGNEDVLRKNESEHNKDGRFSSEIR